MSYFHGELEKDIIVGNFHNTEEMNCTSIKGEEEWQSKTNTKKLLKKIFHLSSFKNGENANVIMLEYFECSIQRKFYIRKNNNKVDPVDTRRIITAHLIPWSNQENCMRTAFF